MRRWFTILLLVMLPLQSMWAAAGSYCHHETGVATQHLGHHEHKHQGEASNKGKVDSGKTAFATDGDCSFCHSGCGAVLADVPAALHLPYATSVNLLAAQRFLSFVPSPPIRPNWQRLV